MTIRSVIFATTILAATTGIASAQSAVGDLHNSATGARDSVRTPTQQQEMKRDQHAKKGSGAAMKGTTGYGDGGPGPAQQSQEKTVSPASQSVGSGLEKEK